MIFLVLLSFFHFFNAIVVHFKLGTVSPHASSKIYYGRFRNKRNINIVLNLQECASVIVTVYREKTDSLFDLVMQLVAYKSLVERNRERERVEGRPIDNNILYLPFVVVNTDKRYPFVRLGLIFSISFFTYLFFPGR